MVENPNNLPQSLVIKKETGIRLLLNFADDLKEHLLILNFVGDLKERAFIDLYVKLCR